MIDIPKDYRPLPQNQPKLKNIIQNPVNPSIPSKWEIKNLNKSNSLDGFGIRTNRFNENDLKDNPGPGYYYEDNNQIIKKSASLSKKGFGNAFLSKCERLPSVILNNNVTGPGYYEVKQINNVYKSDEKKGKFSLSDQNGRVPFDDPLKNASRPGPGEYNVDANFLPKYLQNKSTVAFASESGRDSFLLSAVNAETPSPLTYNPNPASTLPERKIMWSKSQYKRFQDLGVDNKVPGPGRYFDTNLNEEKERYEELSNKRTVGRKTKKLLGKQNERPKIAIHTFGADVHRFKHSFLGRLDLAAEAPGPGWYAPLNIVPLNNKTENESRSQSSPPPIQASGVFKMTGPQRVDIKKPVEHRPPGPAYYHPEIPKPKSYLHNSDTKWI